MSDEEQAASRDRPSDSNLLDRSTPRRTEGGRRGVIDGRSGAGPAIVQVIDVTQLR